MEEHLILIFLKVSTIEGYMGYIREMLDTMEDGRTSISPYDTTWIALVKNLDGLDIPQFPSSLEWIANNQVSDGSWGNEHFFLAYDRLLNTLACVVALRSWNVHVQKIEKGTNQGHKIKNLLTIYLVGMIG
ncbi:Ent-copalyl diphosphate synthase [Forsythia ovata]|uniref:Ent-copalyl diphosphate synthase n=1 Tax=Forsythia ovata TaxID=205694 RepID=A0ABD1T7I9_9LAMI